MATSTLEAVEVIGYRVSLAFMFIDSLIYPYNLLLFLKFLSNAWSIQSPYKVNINSMVNRYKIGC